MLRVGGSVVVAYRAELLIWLLSYTMPLIMLALWAAVARDAPVGRYDQRAFVAYFVATLFVRMMASSWVVWELTDEIKQGTLGMRMLRPVHPLVAYATVNVAAVPMRIVLILPVVLGALAWLGGGVLTRDPVQWLALPVAMTGAWLMTYLVQALVGMLAFWWESSLSLYDLYLGLYMVFSGYVMPLDLFPSWLARVVDVLPFRYMLAFPVEVLLGSQPRATTAHDLALQWLYVAVLFAATAALWRRGARNFAAFGG
jgi:ABC-2 type transport system permease protein